LNCGALIFPLLTPPSRLISVECHCWNRDCDAQKSFVRLAAPRAQTWLEK